LKARGLRRVNKRVKRLVAWILDCYDDSDTILVFTGDIVDNGSEAEYECARAILEPLAERYKLLFAPGNHDVGRMGNAFASSLQNNFQRHVVGELMQVPGAMTATNRMAELYPYVTTTKDCVLIGLDSAHDEEHLASGSVGARQRRRLDALIEGATAPVVVYVHHHPFVRRPWLAMNDAKKLMDLVRGRVHALLFGHKHRYRTWHNRDGICRVNAAPKTSKPRRGTKTGYCLSELNIDGAGLVTFRNREFFLGRRE